MASSWRGLIVLPAIVVLAGCPGPEVGDPEARDPEGVFRDVALADSDRVCETPALGDLLVSGTVLAHADANMHVVGECVNPTRPLYTHVQEIDRPPDEQRLHVRVGDGRYLRVRPAR